MIAAASAASPASWPPISRGSSGKADEVSVTLASLCARLAARFDADGDGVTTGNRLLSPDGEIVVFGIGAIEAGGSEGVVPPVTGE